MIENGQLSWRQYRDYNIDHEKPPAIKFATVQNMRLFGKTEPAAQYKNNLRSSNGYFYKWVSEPLFFLTNIQANPYYTAYNIIA